MVETAATKATRAPAPPAPPARGASLSSHACTPKNEQTSVRIAANSTFQSASPGWNGPAKPAHLTTTAAYNAARRSFTSTRDGGHHPLTTAPGPVSLQVGTERRGSTSGIGRYPPPGVLVPLAASRPGREPPLTHRGRCIMLRAPCTTRAMTGAPACGHQRLFLGHHLRLASISRRLAPCTPIHSFVVFCSSSVCLFSTYPSQTKKSKASAHAVG